MSLGGDRPFWLVGTAGDPRVAGYQAARARAGLAAAPLVDWRELIADPRRAARRIPAGARVRIDSPGRDPAVLAGLLSLGIEACRARGEIHLDHRQIAETLADRGRLLPPRQLYHGLCALLRTLGETAAERHAVLTPDCATVETTFDKTATSTLLRGLAIPVPHALGSVSSFEAIVSAMRTAGLSRAFVKLRHGSAASGAVALALTQTQTRAVSTVEMVGGETLRLYNTRAVRTYTSAREIACLVDALAPLGLHAEAWVPKAGADGFVADIRVLVIAGEPAFRVLRKSPHPMTNLHLGGVRGDADAFLSRMPAAARSALDDNLRAVAKAFPGALQLGVDVAVTVGHRRHAVLEVNAFGDLIKGVLRDGLDPYDVQVRAIEALSAGRGAAA